MRHLIGLVLAVAFLFAASPAAAQDPQTEHRRAVAPYKIASGAALVAIGLFKIADSSGTYELPDPQTGVRREQTFRSTTGILMGLGATGAGGWLIWSGLNDRKAGAPRPAVGVGVQRRKGGLSVRVVRTW